MGTKKNIPNSFWANRANNTNRADVVDDGNVVYNSSGFAFFWGSATGKAILARMEETEPGSAEIFIKAGGQRKVGLDFKLAKEVP